MASEEANTFPSLALETSNDPDEMDDQEKLSKVATLLKTSEKAQKEFSETARQKLGM